MGIRKILTIVSSLGITATGTTSVISCSQKLYKQNQIPDWEYDLIIKNGVIDDQQIINTSLKPKIRPEYQIIINSDYVGSDFGEGIISWVFHFYNFNQSNNNNNWFTTIKAKKGQYQFDFKINFDYSGGSLSIHTFGLFKTNGSTQNSPINLPIGVKFYG